MTTATTLITDALGLLGVVDPVEALEADDATLGLRVLNRLIDSFNVEQPLLYAIEYVSFTLPAATTSRTIGPSGADITLSRPLRVEIGGYASVGGFDYPITPLTRQEYAEVCLKSVSSVTPEGVYYEATSPNGKLYFAPTVSSASTIKLPFATKLGTFAALTTSVTLPEGYESFIVHELAMRLSPFYRAAVSPDIRQEAARLRRLIKRQNWQTPQLETDLPVDRMGSPELGKYL